MAKYGRGAISAQLAFDVERITSSNDLPFKDTLSSQHLADEFAAAAFEYRERIFSPSDHIARFHGTSPVFGSFMPAGRHAGECRTSSHRTQTGFP